MSDSETTRKMVSICILPGSFLFLNKRRTDLWNARLKILIPESFRSLLERTLDLCARWKDGEKFEDYVLEFEKTETCGYRAFDGANNQFDMTGYKPFPSDGTQIPLTYDLLMNDAIWFD